MSTTPRSANPIQKHRREVWLRIITPILLPFVALIILCIVLIIGVATGSLVSKQITVLMGCLGTLFVLIPLVLVCLLPYAALAITAAGVGRVYANFQTPLRFVRRLTERMAGKTHELAPKVAQPLIGLNTRMTRLEHMVRGWTDRPALPARRDTSED